MVNWGDTNIEASSASWAAGYPGAWNRAYFTDRALVTGWHLYFSSAPAAGNTKFAIYKDSGGSPASQNLVGKTGWYARPGSSGWWHPTISSSDYIIVPVAGYYWLSILNDSEPGFIMRYVATADMYYFNGTQTDFPATFAASPTHLTPWGPYSFYASGDYGSKIYVRYVHLVH